VNRETAPIVMTVNVPLGKTITALRLECSTEDDGARVGLARVSAQQGPKKILAMMGAVEGVSLKAIEAERVLNAARKVAVTLQPGPNKPAEAIVWQLTVPLEAKIDSETLDISIAVNSANRETEWRLLYSVDAADQLVAESTLELAARAPESLTRAEQEVLRREFHSHGPSRKRYATRLISSTHASRPSANSSWPQSSCEKRRSPRIPSS